jgi:hypothetical protein
MERPSPAVVLPLLSPPTTRVRSRRRVLAGQRTQAVCPVAFWYVFSLHLAQSSGPQASLKCPVGHGVHSVSWLRRSICVPGAHGLHESYAGTRWWPTLHTDLEQCCRTQELSLSPATVAGGQVGSEEPRSGWGFQWIDVEFVWSYRFAVKSEFVMILGNELAFLTKIIISQKI